MSRPGVGVVIGRFQVAELHEGHLSLLNEAAKHAKLVVFVGVSPSRLGVKSDPLDYPTREQMIKEAFPKAQVFEIVDQYSDKLWSNQLDQRLHALYPRDKSTLYCGRDSFKSSYHGRFPVVEIDPVPHKSGTEFRDIDGQHVENHASFRKGCIYSAYNRWDPIYPCVDIVCWKRDENDIDWILVGQRPEEEGLHRLPGGHIDPSDATDEDAAKRELFEETGVEVSEYLTYLWSGRINSWGDKEGAGTKRTILFLAEYLHGSAKGADDLGSVKWVKLEDALKLQFADDHAKLVHIANEVFFSQL